MTWRAIWDVTFPEMDAADEIALRFRILDMLVERAQVVEDDGWWEIEHGLAWVSEENPEQDAMTLAGRLTIIYSPVFEAFDARGEVTLVQHGIPPGG